MASIFARFFGRKNPKSANEPSSNSKAGARMATSGGADQIEMKRLLESARSMRSTAARRFEEARRDYEDVFGEGTTDVLAAHLCSSSGEAMSDACVVDTQQPKPDEASYAYYLCFQSTKRAKIVFKRLSDKRREIASLVDRQSKVELRDGSGQKAVIYPHWVVIYTPCGTLHRFFKDVDLQLEYEDHDEGGAALINANKASRLFDEFTINPNYSRRF